MIELSTIISDLRGATADGKLQWTLVGEAFHTKVAGVQFFMWFDDDSDMSILGMGEPGTPGCRTASSEVDWLYDEVREQVFCSNGPADRVHAALTGKGRKDKEARKVTQ